jgi:hypothetical protein
MRKSLQHGSNMITIMLWAYSASKDLKIPKKVWSPLQHQVAYSYVEEGFMPQKGILDKLNNYNNLVSIFTIKVIDVKAFDNN